MEIAWINCDMVQISWNNILLYSSDKRRRFTMANFITYQLWADTILFFYNWHKDRDILTVTASVARNEIKGASSIRQCRVRQ